MTNELPQVRHIYQNNSTLDSTRWEHYEPLPGDIVVATPPKSGTTWVQNIVMHLIFQDLEFRKVFHVFPWLENPSRPIQEVLDQLDAQQHRRSLKSHLPLDGIVYHPQVKYIIVNRDARDVFMSMWNHYRNTLDIKTKPQCPDDIREFWGWWMTRGWFDWETEGYPFQSTLRHAQTWWDYRHLPNILFVHYNDLLQDLEGEVRRISSYLKIEVSEDLLLNIVNAVTFKTMKENANQVVGNLEWLRGGGETFINKGTNGRWRDVLTEGDLKLYEAAVKRELTLDCARWLEYGRHAILLD